MELIIHDDYDDNLVIHYDSDCDQTHVYFDLDTEIKPKPKPTLTKAKKVKPLSNLEITQNLLDEYWSELFDTLISLNDDFIIFYNSPTSETEMATLIADKIAALNNVGLHRPTFWTDDNQPSKSSFQSWQPDWETVKWDEFWNQKYPPLKKSRAKKTKST